MLQKGREQTNFTYDPSNMGAAYDAAEAAAMRDADQKASDAADAAAAKYAGLICPLPCGPAEVTTTHGKPFAGATRGGGIARSLWEVDYVCAFAPPPPPPPPAPGVPQIPGGNVNPPPPPPPVSKWHIDVPKIPKCFGLPVDKDEMIEHLQELHRQALVNLPLGAEKGDPDFEEALQQRDINLSNIDAAIKQAEATPLCPPGLFDHLHIGIGVGIGTGGDHRRHGRDHDSDHPADHPADHPHSKPSDDGPHD